MRKKSPRFRNIRKDENSENKSHNTRSKGLESLRNFSKKNVEEEEEEHVNMLTFENSNSSLIHKFPEYKVPTRSMPFLLIAPSDIVNFESEMYIKLKDLASNYDLHKTLEFICGNLEEYKIRNIDNLQLLIEDSQFWLESLPKLLQFLVENIETVASRIKILPSKETGKVELTRKQVLVIVFSMFLGIMPQQFLEESPTFGYLFAHIEVQNDSHLKNILKIQKLKCYLAYFKTMINNQHLFSQKIVVKRTHDFTDPFQFYISKIKLRKVQIHYQEDLFVHDFLDQAILVAFSGKKIGEQALKAKYSDEERMFTVFPELLITKLLCEEVQQKQSITVQGVRKFSCVRGTEKSFIFKGAENQWENEEQPSESVVVFLDAFNFHPQKNIYRVYINQYSKKGTKREITKAVIGFKNVANINKNIKIATSNWGCEENHGDEDLKFIIQWIACSLVKRQMVYVAKDSRKAKEYQCLAREFSKETVSFMINLLEKYEQFRNKVKRTPIPGLLEYIKNDFIL